MVLPDGVLLTKTRLHKIGVLLTKKDYTKLALSRIDIYEAGSLLMAENMLTPIIQPWNFEI